MNIVALVVGATGIAGRGACQELIRRGAEVHGLSRNPKGLVPGVRHVAADLLIAEDPGELLRRVGGERDPGPAALHGVRHHRTGIAGPDQDQIDAAVTGRHHRDVVFAVLAHRARVERADLVPVLVGRADEAGGVVQ